MRFAPAEAMFQLGPFRSRDPNDSSPGRPSHSRNCRPPSGPFKGVGPAREPEVLPLADARPEPEPPPAGEVSSRRDGSGGA